jgi:hypothetical protein
MHDPLSRFGEALAALPVELASRRRHDRPAEIYHVKSERDAPGLPGGSICVVSGKTGARFVEEVREAARKGDAAAVAEVLHAHEGHLHRRAREASERSVHEPTGEALAKIPAITELSYRGKPVAEGMIVHPELDAMRVLVPYAGGRLDSSGFVASTYAHGKHVPAVDTVVVVREPCPRRSTSLSSETRASSPTGGSPRPGWCSSWSSSPACCSPNTRRNKSKRKKPKTRKN